MLVRTRASRILLPIFLLLILAVGDPSEAQVSSALDRLEIVLWPEYDQPALLVMLRAWLPTDAHLPTYVPLSIPAGVTPSAVAKRGEDGSLLLAAHTIIDHRFYQEVRIMADTREIRVEYYVPLSIEGPNRRHVFEWPGGLALGSVRYELQQPIGAVGMSVIPSADSQSTGFDGLTYLAADLGSRSQADTFTVQFTYAKSSPELTRTALQKVSPTVADLTQEPPVEGFATAVQVPETARFPWLVVLPVVLLVGLILVWFLQSGSDSQSARDGSAGDR